MKVSEQLDLAADMIQQHGWTRGGSGWDNERGAGLCLEGGIAAAVGIKLLGVRPGAFAKGRRDLTTCPAYQAVEEYLYPHGGVALWAWNDHPDTTAEQVIETLRAAAAVERTKEAIPAEVAS